MNLSSKAFTKSLQKTFLLSVLCCLVLTSTHSQVRIAGLVGISYNSSKSVPLTGVLNAGYEFKGISLLYDQRHQLFKSGSWFGSNAGYTIKKVNFSLRPYVGCWYKLVGNKNVTDRFIQNGTEKILAKNKAVNSWTGGYGLQLFAGKYMIDLSYQGVFSFTLGMGGLLD